MNPASTEHRISETFFVTKLRRGRNTDRKTDIQNMATRKWGIGLRTE